MCSSSIYPVCPRGRMVSRFCFVRAVWFLARIRYPRFLRERSAEGVGTRDGTSDRPGHSKSRAGGNYLLLYDSGEKSFVSYWCDRVLPCPVLSFSSRRLAPPFRRLTSPGQASPPPPWASCFELCNRSVSFLCRFSCFLLLLFFLCRQCFARLPGPSPPPIPRNQLAQR